MLLLPGLHGRFVLLELVAPVGVDLLVVVALVRRCASVGIHGDVVTAQERSPQMAIIPATVGLVHGNHHQATFCRFDVLGRVVLDLVAALLLRVVVPRDGLVLQDLRHLDEATEVDRLAVRDDDLLLQHARVADVVRLVADVLQQSQLVRFARVGVLVPATVRILNAPVATVVPPVTHGQIDLLDAIIRGHVQRLA